MKKIKKAILLVIVLGLMTGCGTAKLSDGKESVVTFKDNAGISAETLYEKLKDKHGVEVLVNLIDTELLSKEYSKTDSEQDYVDNMFNSYKKQWGDNFKSYMAYYFGVSTEDELKEYIRLNYRRNAWTEDYAKKQVTDKEINDYYKDYVVGDITASHILIASEATDKMSDSEKKAAEEKALKLAKEIIEKLKKGEKFEDLAKEYSDDSSNSEKGGVLSTFNDRSNLDKNFLESAIKLEVGKYSTTPVKSQYGYHIIYKTKQEDKPELDKVKTSVIAKIANEKIENDSSFASKALVALREKYEMNITDNKLESSYNSVYKTK